MRVTLRTHDIPLRETRRMDMNTTWKTTVFRRTAVPAEHIAHLRQKCHNSKCVIFSVLSFKGSEVLLFSMSATTTQLLSSGEFCKLRYDTIPVESASANVSSYTNNSKNAKF
jgi:hypothetical protein